MSVSRESSVRPPGGSRVRCQRADVPCAGGCGRLLWSGTHSLPAGQRMCQPCRGLTRAERSAPVVRTVRCAGCGAGFTTTVPTKRFCGESCRTQAKKRRKRARELGSRPPRPPTPCADCGAAVPYPAHGRPSLRCADCRAKYAAEKARARHREIRRAMALLEMIETTPEPAPPGRALVERFRAAWRRTTHTDDKEN